MNSANLDFYFILEVTHTHTHTHSYVHIDIVEWNELVYRKTETKREREKEREIEWKMIKETNGCLGGILYTHYMRRRLWWLLGAGSTSQPLPPLTLCMRSLRVDSVRVIYGDEYILLLCARRIYTRRPPFSWPRPIFFEYNNNNIIYTRVRIVIIITTE